jgi:hypothetical protein
MPKGPNGQKRPADAIGLAVMIGKIATGEVEDTRDDVSSAAAQMGNCKGSGGEAVVKIYLTQAGRFCNLLA